MKKAIVTTLVLAMTVSMAGCGAGKKAPEKAASSAAAAVSSTAAAVTSEAEATASEATAAVSETAAAAADAVSTAAEGRNKNGKKTGKASCCSFSMSTRNCDFAEKFPHQACKTVAEGQRKNSCTRTIQRQQKSCYQNAAHKGDRAKHKMIFIALTSCNFCNF